MPLRYSKASFTPEPPRRCDRLFASGVSRASARAGTEVRGRVEIRIYLDSQSTVGVSIAADILVPNIATVSDVSNIPQNDVGKHVSSYIAQSNGHISMGFVMVCGRSIARG